MPPLMKHDESPMRKTKSLLTRDKRDVQPFIPQRRGFFEVASNQPPRSITNAEPQPTTTSTARLSLGLTNDLLNLEKVKLSIRLLEQEIDVLAVNRAAMASSKSDGAGSVMDRKSMKNRSSSTLSQSDHGPRTRSFPDEDDIESSAHYGKTGRKKPKERLSLSDHGQRRNTTSTFHSPSTSSPLESGTRSKNNTRSLMMKKMKKTQSCPSNLSMAGCTCNTFPGRGQCRRTSMASPLETIDEFRATCFAMKRASRKGLGTSQSSNSIYFTS